MVNSVSNLGQFTYVQAAVTTTQNQLDTVQEQLSTGRLADTYAGLGAQNTAVSLSLNSQANQLGAINDAINNVTPITGAMDSALSSITQGANSVASAMTAVTQNSAPNIAAVNQTAQSVLAAMQSMLNSQVNGVSVFAASDSANAPVANTSNLSTNTSTDLAAFAAGTETAAQVLSNIQGYTATQMGYSSTLANAKNVSVPTAPGVSTDYTVKADGSGMQTLMQGLSIMANLQYTPSDESGFYQIYNGALKMIQDGSTAVTANQSSLGLATQTMTTAQTQITATQTTLNSAISGVQDLSTSQTAAASTKLSALSTQLQTSYEIIAQLQSIHLVDYLTA